MLASIGLAAFGFFCFGVAGHPQRRGARSPRWPIAGAMVFVAFVLMIVRRDVASQAIGFFSLENAISLAALVVAAGLPLILEIAFLFDLLVAVVVFGMLIRVHHARAESLSTADLTGCADERRCSQSSWPSSSSRWPRRSPASGTRPGCGGRSRSASGIACFGLVLVAGPGGRARRR